MAGFGEQLQAAAPVLLGIGSQASGRDPAGIARGVALLQAQQERDKRKAAIDNMLSGMGIAGPEKAFLESMPEAAAQQEILRRMQPKERRIQFVDGKAVDMDTLEVVGDFRDKPQPLPPGLFGNGDYIDYSNQNATRSGPLNTELVQAFDFLPEMGLRMEVFSGGQPSSGPNRIGTHRHDNGMAGDVFLYQGDRRLDWRNPDDIPVFQEVVRRGKAKGMSFGAGEGYMHPGSMHVGIGNGPMAVWGRNGDGEFAAQWLKDAYYGASGPASGGGGAQPPKQTGFDAQIGAFDTSINKLTAVLASGAGTPAQRDQLEYKRKELEARRDALIERQQAAAKAAAGPGFDTDLANTYRDDMRTEPALTLFADVQSGFDAIEQFYQAPGAVSDYALAVAFAKIVDPGSVAREGEVAAVSSAAGAYPAFEQALKNAITREGKMPPEMRKEIADLGAKLYAKKADRASTVLDSYQRRAERMKIPFDEIWANGPIRTLPDDWVSTVEVQPNAVDRFNPPPVVPETASEPTRPSAPEMAAPTKDDVQAAIDSMTPAQKKTFGRLRTPSAKLDYLEKLGKL